MYRKILKGDTVVSIPVVMHVGQVGEYVSNVSVRVVNCDDQATASDRVKRALEFLVNNLHEIEGLL